MLIRARIIILLLILPFIADCQEDMGRREFLINFHRCIKLKTGERPEKEQAIIYFEVEKRDSQIVLTHVVGEHEEVVYRVLRKTLDCINTDSIPDRSFNCILLIKEIKTYHKKVEQRWREKDEKIKQFKIRYNLDDEIDLIEVGYTRPIR